MEHFAAVIAKTIMTCVAQLLTPARQVRTLLVNGEPSALADFGRSQEYTVQSASRRTGPPSVHSHIVAVLYASQPAPHPCPWILLGLANRQLY